MVETPFNLGFLSYQSLSLPCSFVLLQDRIFIKASSLIDTTRSSRRSIRILPRTRNNSTELPSRPSGSCRHRHRSVAGAAAAGTASGAGPGEDRSIDPEGDRTQAEAAEGSNHPAGGEDPGCSSRFETLFVRFLLLPESNGYDFWMRNGDGECERFISRKERMIVRCFVG